MGKYVRSRTSLRIEEMERRTTPLFLIRFVETTHSPQSARPTICLST